MTINEIRCVKHLVTAASEIGPAILRDYDTFERMMWTLDNRDMKRFDLDDRQFRRCLRAAYVELKRE